MSVSRVYYSVKERYGERSEGYRRRCLKLRNGQVWTACPGRYSLLWWSC